MSPGGNPGGGYTFVELDGSTTISVGSGDGQKDWDLSAVIPANTIAVFVSAISSSVSISVRPAGSAVTTQQIAGGMLKSGVSSSLHVEVTNFAVGPNTVKLVGYEY